MENVTSRKETRARLVEQQNAAKAARAAQEEANISDLTEFIFRVNQSDVVDGWLAEKVEKLKSDADARRLKHKVAAGKALHAMRMRGESVSAIAEQAQISVGRVREFLRLAADAAETEAVESATPRGEVVAMPGRAERAVDGRDGEQAAVGAH